MKSMIRLLAGLCAVVGSMVPLAASTQAAGTCQAGLTLKLQVGVHGVPNLARKPIAHDIPRGHFWVSVPFYPGATLLRQFVGKPVPEFPTSPYLQMAVAEYQTAAPESTVMGWYQSAFAGCGWKKVGSFHTNSNLLHQGIFFSPANNRNLRVDLSFGQTASGGTYIAYAVEDITYPPRPARSYLHGPFTQVTITVRHNLVQSGTHFLSHLTVTRHAAIARLVKAINSVHGYHTVLGICIGGGPSPLGPVWLTFMRPNGTAVHAFESGIGACGGLAVNGVRWLIDPGRVWRLVTRLV